MEEFHDVSDNTSTSEIRSELKAIYESHVAQEGNANHAYTVSLNSSYVFYNFHCQWTLCLIFSYSNKFTRKFDYNENSNYNWIQGQV